MAERSEGWYTCWIQKAPDMLEEWIKFNTTVFKGTKLTSIPEWNIHTLRYRLGKTWLNNSIYIYIARYIYKNIYTSFAVYIPWVNIVPIVTVKATVTLECLSRSRGSSIKTTAVLWPGLGTPHLKHPHSFLSPTLHGTHSCNRTERLMLWPETVISAEQVKYALSARRWKRKLRHGWRQTLHAFVLSCVWLDAMDCSPMGCSVHGIFQARTLEWVAISSSRGSSQPRDRTQVSHIAGRYFTIWATKEAPEYWNG